jgi:diguanylate cyclase (GGDEF)-like protein
MIHLRAKLVPAFAALSLSAIGTGVVGGWIFRIEPLMTVFPGLIRMKSNTAVAFLFAAAALYLADKRRYRTVQAVCASMMFLFGFVTLLEYVSGVNAHIDQLFFHDPIQFPYPGRMAHITAVNFVLCGAMLYPFRFRGSDKFTDALALLVCSGSAFAIVGYLYGVPFLYGSIHYTAMAVHTGFGFLLMSVGFLYIQKDRGLVGIFRVKTAGGVVARWLVPPAILIPILVGGVFNRFNFGQPKLGITFIVVGNVFLVVASIWGLAHVLDKSETERGLAQRASEIDALTGIHNRGYFDHRLRVEIQRCVRHSRESCLILFDIDHFKNLNDRFGHQAGDRVLKTIAQACEKSLRATDVVCRYGGEEFAIIAAETAAADAMILARKIRDQVAVLHFDKVPIRVTISLGVVQIDSTTASSQVAIAAADQALYGAKKRGRNRECLHGDIRTFA